MSFSKVFTKYKHYEGEQKGNPKQWEKAFNTTFRKEQGQHEEFYTLYACTNETQLKKEFRRLAKLYHPDKLNGDTAKTLRLLETYENLKARL